MELVADMYTDMFIKSLAVRKGLPTKFLSYDGKNFKVTSVSVERVFKDKTVIDQFLPWEQNGTLFNVLKRPLME